MGDWAFCQGGTAPANETLSQSYRGNKARDWEAQKVAPIKVFDNLYYVGPGNVSVWLIPTTDGVIVFDATQEPLVDHVLDSIRKVGFDPKNIRYIFITHGHLDHKEFADVEVPVHVHSWLTTYPDPRGGTVFEPAMQLAKRQPGQPHPFVIPDLWRQWLDRTEAGTIKYIEDAKAKAAAPTN